jgi:hypothetical protein
MNEDETIMHMVVQVLGADGISVMMELGQLIGLQRLLHAEEEQLTGRHGFIISAEVGEDDVNRAVGWRWAGEDEDTMEWQPLPFATLPEPEGHED